MKQPELNWVLSPKKYSVLIQTITLLKLGAQFSFEQKVKEEFCD